ncbi:MAG TPA: sugar ABC transporter permease [Bauldia sp.]|nr:sugar ABC transporter permease [Bauldia sp.]
MTDILLRLHRPVNRERTLAAMLLLPTLIIVGTMVVVPLVYAFWLSLHDVQASPRAERPFVGFANYIAILASPAFQHALWNTAYFTVVSLVVQVPVGLAIAILLDQKFPGRGIVRAMILIPWALPTIVNGALWQWIYNPSYGALNGLLRQLGLIHEPVLWLGSPIAAMNAVIVADTWKILPFYAVMFLAGLQTIPRELFDASTVDGATPLDKLRYVIIPLLKPFFLVVLVLRTTEMFRAFDLIYMLTSGGPAGGTTVVAYYAYQVTFQSLRFGYGSAVSFIIGAVGLAFALIYVRVIRAGEIR